MAVVVTGLIVTACAAVLFEPAGWNTFLFCAVLAVVASTFKVSLPGLGSTISPAFVFVLLASAVLNWPQTVVVGLISALVQSLCRAQSRPRALQVGFNAAALALSAGLAHGVSRAMVASQSLTLRLAVASVVLLAANSALTAGVLSLDLQIPLRRAWQSLQMWSVPYYLAGSALASVWAQAELPLATGVALMAAVSVFLLDAAYRQMVARIVSNTN